MTFNIPLQYIAYALYAVGAILLLSACVYVIQALQALSNRIAETVFNTEVLRKSVKRLYERSDELDNRQDSQGVYIGELTDIKDALQWVRDKEDELDSAKTLRQDIKTLRQDTKTELLNIRTQLYKIKEHITLERNAETPTFGSMAAKMMDPIPKDWEDVLSKARNGCLLQIVGEVIYRTHETARWHLPVLSKPQIDSLAHQLSKTAMERGYTNQAQDYKRELEFWSEDTPPNHLDSNYSMKRGEIKYRYSKTGDPISEMGKIA